MCAGWGKECQMNGKLNVLVPIFKEKKDIRSCKMYIGIKLSEHAISIVERVLEKKIPEVVEADEMQFGVMPDSGTAETLFIVRRIHKKY